MDLKFVTLLKSFFPKGKIWEFQTNFNYLIDGLSVEYGRAYNSAKEFYENFNIIESESLAKEHSLDYLIVQGLYTKLELQRIIVEYLNQDLGLKEIIEDFANFTNVSISWENPHAPFIFDSSKFGDKFGDKDNPGIMELLIKFGSSVTCKEYNKIYWLMEYLKPPYLDVQYTNKPLQANDKFIFDSSKFGDKFVNQVACELIK